MPNGAKRSYLSCASFCFTSPRPCSQTCSLTTTHSPLSPGILQHAPRWQRNPFTFLSQLQLHLPPAWLLGSIGLSSPTTTIASHPVQNATPSLATSSTSRGTISTTRSTNGKTSTVCHILHLHYTFHQHHASLRHTQVTSSMQISSANQST